MNTAPDNPRTAANAPTTIRSSVPLEGAVVDDVELGVVVAVVVGVVVLEVVVGVVVVVDVSTYIVNPPLLPALLESPL
jgi:hypothetical protein